MGRSKRNEKKKRKKGRRGWTTDSQEEYLTDLIPAYRATQASNARSDFWPPVWEKYFEQWPPQLPADSQLAEMSDKEKEKALAKVLARTQKVSMQRTYRQRVTCTHKFTFRGLNNGLIIIHVKGIPGRRRNYWISP